MDRFIIIRVKDPVLFIKELWGIERLRLYSGSSEIDIAALENIAKEKHNHQVQITGDGITFTFYTYTGDLFSDYSHLMALRRFIGRLDFEYYVSRTKPCKISNMSFEGVHSRTVPVRCSRTGSNVSLTIHFNLHTEMGMDGSVYPVSVKVLCSGSPRCSFLKEARCCFCRPEDLNSLDVLIMKGEPQLVFSEKGDHLIEVPYNYPEGMRVTFMGGVQK